jgi:peptidoglycan/xylan/chitin deacetylase (PgdA/CDA1 family)
MADIEEAGCRVVSLAELRGWMRDGLELPNRAVALTFDDGFADFATVAFAELRRRGWPATVFVATGCVGGFNAWEAPAGSPGLRRLMDWPTIAELSACGVDFGGHGVLHRDLTSVRGEALEAEVLGAKRAIEDRTGRPVAAFAAPYGRSDPEVSRVVRRHYTLALGTELARARRGSDLYEIPRIEMWYFRRARRWRAFLRGDAEGFLRTRRVLRRVRRLAASITFR